jgi:NAD(P)-dependent dehydrogenase (short-subunit alcohol dehydrogenase family)
LAARGADIAVCGLPADEKLAQGVKADVAALQRCALTITADVAAPAEAARCVKETIAQFGRLDVLVHCAGGPAQGSLLEVDNCTWYRAFDIHVHAVHHLTRAARAGDDRGRRWRHSADCLRGRSARLCRRDRLRSGQGSDTAIHTRIGARAGGLQHPRELRFSRNLRTRFQDYLTPGQVENNTQNRIPLHREGRPEEVASRLLALVENDFITGAEIPVDGGMTMRMV